MIVDMEGPGPLCAVPPLGRQLVLGVIGKQAEDHGQQVESWRARGAAGTVFSPSLCGHQLHF